MIYSIYKITNKINGKHYIGFTNNFYDRMKSHKSSANKPKRQHKLANAIRKYGWDNFTKDIIYQSPDRDHTLDMEKVFITEYNSQSKGYNNSGGGEVSPMITTDRQKHKLNTKLAMDNPIVKAKLHNAWTDDRKVRMIATRTTNGHLYPAFASSKVSCIYCRKVNNLGNHTKHHGSKCKSIK